MAWFRLGGAGISAALKNAMTAVLNKKLGTSQEYAPNAWPEEVNLLGALEEKTASGSIVTFSDGADDVPLKSCEVTLPASLDGYSSVDVVTTGKNVIDYASNLTTGTSGGLTFSVTADGGISYSGTASSTFAYVTAKFDFDIKSGQTFTFSRNTAFSYIHRITLTFSDNTTANISIPADDTSVTYTPTKDVIAVRLLVAGLTANTAYNDTVYLMTEYGSTATTYEPYTAPTTHTASLGRTIYGGQVDVVNGEGTDENGNDFTFEPVEINSKLGNNTMWSDGDMSVVYRASGTVTPIQPTLISKSITQNGTYAAADDDADGYSEVTVNVPSQEPTVEPLNSPNAFTTTSGISGTDVERVIRTITAPNDGKYVFASDSTCRTNTGGGDGFIEIRKNDVSVVKQYMAANTTTDITIPDISVEAGDDIDIVGGFDNAHSSCNFQLYTGIAFVSEASVSLLSMSNSNSTNELENELNNLDESEAEQNEELI